MGQKNLTGYECNWRRAVRWLMGVLPLSLAVYAAFVEPQWIAVRKSRIQSPMWPPVRIVQLSDLHIQDMGVRETRVLKIVGELKPDIVVLSGDVIDRNEAMETLDTFLAGLPSAQKFAVLGNWEYWGNIRRDHLEKIYANRGVKLLINARSDLRIKGGDLAVIGVDDFTAGQPVSTDMLPGRNERKPLLVLQHSPGYFGQIVGKPSNEYTEPTFCLSGHTHGGQVTLFGIPIWTPPGSGEFASGWYRTDICNLYVSKGIGISGPPIRFWSRPEIAVFDFR